MLEQLAVRNTSGTSSYYSGIPHIKSEFVGIVGNREKGLAYRRLDLEYRIESPSSISGERRYRLNYAKYISGEETLLEVSQIAGYVAEQVMRIRVKELFRRIKSTFDIQKHDFLKRDSLNGYQISNDRYDGTFIGRHNIEIRKKNPRSGEVDKKVLSEYDGVLVYQIGSGSSARKGIIVCESKLGVLDNLSCTTPHQKELTTKKLITPIHALFPGYEHRLLLSTPLANAITPQKRQVKKPHVQLATHLATKDSKLLLFPFSESAESFWEIARHAQSLREHYHPEEILKQQNTMDGFSVYYPDPKTRYLFYNDAVVEITERTGRNWRIIYEK